MNDFEKEISDKVPGEICHADNWDDSVLGTIYGNCIGDAIGLLTEFMEKKQIKKHYGKFKELEFFHKISDRHRDRWEVGDWTDDGDQMILIMISLLAKQGKMDPVDFGVRLLGWMRHGYPELGDRVGCGIGENTYKVLSHPLYRSAPQCAAESVWKDSSKQAASNGGVMRTSVLGIFQYDDIEKVISNTQNICTVTHFDPRCQASCIAVTTAIAMMLRKCPKHMKSKKEYDIDAIMEDSFKYAQTCLPKEDEGPRKGFYHQCLHRTSCISSIDHVALLRKHMFAPSLNDLNLTEPNKIGYTYKCMGAGFWAFRQDNFREAITAILKEGGDADTNCAVAGALLGCKLGFKNLPESWRNGLKHKCWLREKVDLFIKLVNDEVASRAEKPMCDGKSIEDRKKEEAT